MKLQVNWTGARTSWERNKTLVALLIWKWNKTAFWESLLTSRQAFHLWAILLPKLEALNWQFLLRILRLALASCDWEVQKVSIHSHWPAAAVLTQEVLQVQGWALPTLGASQWDLNVASSYLVFWRSFWAVILCEVWKHCQTDFSFGFCDDCLRSACFHLASGANVLLNLIKSSKCMTGLWNFSVKLFRWTLKMIAFLKFNFVIKCYNGWGNAVMCSYHSLVNWTWLGLV